jgi:hypothetical protein
MRRLTVAQPEAVEVLLAKLRARAGGNPAWYRVMRAAGRAEERYRDSGTPDFRGFYHGLLTGYAVAIKALQGKMTA